MSEERTVAQTSRDLAVAMLAGDERHLASLLSDQLSYGHQGGVVQGKAAFIGMIAAKKPYKSITITEDTTSIAGNNAIVRHVFAAEFEDDGKKRSAKIGALEVWVKNGENWKLLARQGFRI
jgi:ketosteroid isomerase-like protein